MMNKKATNLTFLLMGIIVFVGMTILIFDSYNNFLIDNSMIMDPVLSKSFGNITSMEDNLTSFQTSFKLDAASAWGVLEGITKNVYATLAIGGTVITSLISLPTYIQRFVLVIRDAMPGMFPQALVWIIITISGIWVGSMILKSLRGTEQT